MREYCTKETKLDPTCNIYIYIYIYIYICTHGIFTQHCSYISDATAVADHMAMIACHQTFPVKINICPVKSNLVRQIYCTLAMDKNKSPSLPNVQTIFSP